MTSADVRTLTEGAIRLGIAIEPNAVARLERFLTILAEWNRPLRLTGERTVRAIIEQHVVDSLAVVPRLPSAGLIADIGSGAGFPGIVIGCMRPDLEVVLIESRRRRTSFLREAIRTIPLPRARALEVRAEEAGRDTVLARRVDLAIGRALRLDVFLGLAKPLLSPRGVAIAMQTPRTAPHSDRAAASQGVRLVGRHDYALPGGAERTLLVFATMPEPVP